MATHRISILDANTLPESTVFPDLIANHITEAATPSVGFMACFVLNDGGVDEGIFGGFSIPKNYVGSPVIVVKGILDGAPGASETLGFGFRKRAVANNEAADATFDAEQVASETIGSSGTNHVDEDNYVETIALTAGDYSIDDDVYFYCFLDSSGTSYTGNFLLTDVQFEYADA